MGALARIGRIAGKINERTLGAGQRFLRLNFDPALSRSYWPEEPRKSKARIFSELAWWLLRHGEVNGYYYVYGMDRRDHPRRDVLSYRSFRRIRNHANLQSTTAKYNYVCLLRDKFIFAQLLSSLSIATPRAYALLDRDTVFWLADGRAEPLESLASLPQSVDGFCKKVDGIQGAGAFRLAMRSGQMFVQGDATSIAELRTRLDGRYLLQERIRQHPEMSLMNPAAVNTVRLITFHHDGRPQLAFAAMRIGVRGKSVDNWAAGGLIVKVDAATGTVRGDGFFKPGYGGRARQHPDTGVQLDGFCIPHFHDAVAQALRLHAYLPQIHSVGWDVAIAEHGPTIIEGNDDWEGGIPMVLEDNFKRQFLAMYARGGPARGNWSAPEAEVLRRTQDERM